MDDWLEFAESDDEGSASGAEVCCSTDWVDTAAINLLPSTSLVTTFRSEERGGSPLATGLSF